MQKTIIYVALLFIVASGVYFLVFNKQEELFSKDETAFRIKDVQQISKIYMARTNGEAVLLEKKPDGSWMVNGKYPVLEGTLNTLLYTLGTQEASYPVPENNHNSVVRSLAANSIKVEVYGSEDNKKLTTFYVGSEAHNYEGTYMLTEGAERPYVVGIPGYKGFLTTRYSTNLADWRARTVFRFDPADIKSVSVEYPDQPLNSFTIEQHQGTVRMVTKENVGGSNPLNEKRVRSFLKFFSALNSEGYINGMLGIDSILKSVPRRASIQAIGNNGKQQTLDVYWMPLNKRSKNQLTLMPGQPEEFDADRFYGVTNGGKDTVIIQSFVFDKIFRKAYEFYEADKQEKVLGLDIKKQ